MNLIQFVKHKTANFICGVFLNNNQRKVVGMLKVILSEYGYWNSLKKGYPCDKNGDYLPWYTYPSIEFLNRIDFSDKNVFEWGSGYSSMYWSEKAKTVVSVENNRKWFNKVSEIKNGNMKVEYRSAKNKYIESIMEQDKKFDVIVIDGSYRLDCAKISKRHLKKGGFILLDNSDWFPRSCKMLRSFGFVQIDFFGLGPLNNYSWSTSMFFNKETDTKFKSQYFSAVGGIVSNDET